MCAQSNTLWDRLTPQETVEMIGQIKGLSKETRKAQVRPLSTELINIYSGKLHSESSSDE